MESLTPAAMEYLKALCFVIWGAGVLVWIIGYPMMCIRNKKKFSADQWAGFACLLIMFGWSWPAFLIVFGFYGVIQAIGKFINRFT